MMYTLHCIGKLDQLNVANRHTGDIDIDIDFEIGIVGVMVM